MSRYSKETSRLLEHFRGVYPALLETQLAIIRGDGNGELASAHRLKTALRAEIGELLNDLKPAWSLRPSGGAIAETYLGKAADVLFYALSLDVEAVWRRFHEYEAMRGREAGTFAEFAMNEAASVIEEVGCYYFCGTGWPGEPGTDLAQMLLEQEVCLAGGTCDPLGILFKKGLLPLAIENCPDDRQLNKTFYVQLLAIAGMDVDQLVEAYYGKIKKRS